MSANRYIQVLIKGNLQRMAATPSFGWATKLRINYHTLRQMLVEAWNSPEITEDTTIVYLDQKQWIQLSNHYRGDAYNPDIAQVLKFIQDSSTSTKVVYPISVIHLMETASRVDDATRNDLLDLMLDISDLYTMAPPTLIEQKEAEFYADRRQGNDPDERNQIFQKGIVHSVFGTANPLTETDELSEDQEDMTNAFLRTKYGFKLIFNHETVYPYLKNRRIEAQLKQYIEQQLQRRNSIPSNKQKQYLRKSISDYFNDNIREYVKQACSDQDVKPELPDQDEMDQWITGNGGEDVGDLLREFPMMYVYLTLTFVRNQESNGTIDRNDRNDLLSLSPAIAYADIVLTETDWTNRFHRYDLHQHFDTTVRDDITQLLDLLD